jgi:glycyl-radical enzyme activating protein
MTSGILFDIQRFGLHDGPGIRTVVFLKGCPLHCAWCHNPESQARQAQVRFRSEVCAQCGVCVGACDHGAHQLEASGHQYDRTSCEVCGQCIEECVYEALSLTGKLYTVEDVMAIVRRDRTYYEQSGGGMTLTGGEPLAQPGFTEALLEAARSEGVHTCIETSGYATRVVLERVLPWTDLFLYDYKATGDLHFSLTGVDSRRILANLDYLMRSDARVRLRCPLAPGVNDTDEHLQAIAALDARYPALEGIDLLPYHNIANGKYAEYGLINRLPDLCSASMEEQLGWIERLRELGCEKVILG